MINKDSFTYRPCPICSGKRYRRIFEAKADSFFAERFGFTTATIVQCLSCGMRYTNPILKQEIDALQYLEGRGYNRPAKDSMESLCGEDQIICCKEILEHTDMKNKRLLDVGCGEGGFVYLCQQNGFDAYGVELNRNAVIRAGRLGIKNISSVNLEQIESNSFDVVTAIHVLEHLQNCRNFAQQASRILKSKGIVLVIVPNYFAFLSRFRAHRYWNFPFQHMNGLTAWSLDRLFNDFGFNRIPLQAHFAKKNDELMIKTRISMIITKVLGNRLNLFPTKLICVYQQ